MSRLFCRPPVKGGSERVFRERGVCFFENQTPRWRAKAEALLKQLWQLE